MFEIKRCHFSTALKGIKHHIGKCVIMYVSEWVSETLYSFIYNIISNRSWDNKNLGLYFWLWFAIINDLNLLHPIYIQLVNVRTLLYQWTCQLSRALRYSFPTPRVKTRSTSTKIWLLFAEIIERTHDIFGYRWFQKRKGW